MTICLNNHVLVEPLPHNDFVEGSDKLEPMGTVLTIAEGITEVSVGDTVYFEEFLAKKFPTDEPDKFLWFIPVNEICGKK
jgi:hypothetical protein